MKSRTGFSTIIVLIGFSFLRAQNLDYPEVERFDKIERQSQPEFKKTTKKEGLLTKEEWKALIDERWGEGLPADEKLAIFDEFWRRIDEEFPGFPNSTVNWDSLRNHYRPEVEAGVSRGRFCAIINHMIRALREGHVTAYDIDIYNDVLEPGVPLMVGDGVYSHIGAALTPLSDSTLLVYEVGDNNPLGLERGDRILGYDGYPWTYLYRYLLSCELPITRTHFGSTKKSYEHKLLKAAGANWHLFDSIDIVKYGSNDTLHLSTDLLVNQEMEFIGTEQMPIPGVPFPAILSESISWGIIENTNIGYIYNRRWDYGFNSEDFETAVRDLMYNHNTSGLILDNRLSDGGDPIFFNNGLKYLFNEDVDFFEALLRDDPNDHLGFGPSPIKWSSGFKATTDIYDKPIAILNGPFSLSAADLYPLIARRHPYARAFGKPTNGAFTGSLPPDDPLADGWFMFYTTHGLRLMNEPQKFLVHTAPPVDEEIWLEPDDVRNGEDTVVKRAIEWIQHVAYAHDVSIDRTFVNDTEGPPRPVFTAQLANPSNNDVMLRAIVNDIETGVAIDTLDMFDDGDHDDVAAGDNIWGNSYSEALLTKTYGISVTTQDLTASTSRTLPNVVRFTGVGPLKLSEWEFAREFPSYRLTLSLVNQSETATAHDVTVEISSDVVGNITHLPDTTQIDIAAGNSMDMGNYFMFLNDSITRLPLTVKILSKGWPFWTDSISIDLNALALDKQGHLPNSFKLAQNYPNPFNPSTTIEFQIPNSQFVTLKIYNILGEEIITLVDNKLKAGSHTYHFDGSHLASGIYLYRIKTGGFEETKKMMLLR